MFDAVMTDIREMCISPIIIKGMEPDSGGTHAAFQIYRVAAEARIDSVGYVGICTVVVW